MNPVESITSEKAGANGHARAVAAAGDRVLFAMSAKEQELFFPGQDLEDFAAAKSERGAAKSQFCDPKSLRGDGWRRLLEEYGPTVMVSAWSTPRIPEEWIASDNLPLRYVCHVTGSVKATAPRSLIARGVMVTNWGSSISYTVAEHALLLVLGCLRRVSRWPAVMAAPGDVFQMLPHLRTRALRGKRVGLHGFGAVAREIVHLLRPFQVEITACSPQAPAALFEEFGVARVDTLEELFSRSDVLIECEGLTPRTRGSVTERILRLLPEDAVFVNVGRGAIVEEAALRALATEERIRVGLDVFQSEPTSLGSAWAEVPDALLSPHIAGPTWDVYPLCGQFALENLRLFLNGATPEALVTLPVYDRST